MHADSPKEYIVVATVPTARGARTRVLDPLIRCLFTCTADYGPVPAPTPANPRPRPGIVPSTFRVLEYGR